jgi:beta-lactamase regulating signal transducer with metallopeptidase domain
MHLLNEPLMHRLGWTLIHFIWQGALFALFLRIVLVILRRGSAQTRGIAASTTLLAMALAPIATFCMLKAPMAPEFAVASGSAKPADPAMQGMQSAAQWDAARVNSNLLSHVTGAGPERSGHGVAKLADSIFRTLVPWVPPIWLLGVCLCLGRLLCGWFLTERIKRRSAPITGDIERCITELARRIGVSRPVRLMEAALAHGPAVMGWLRPVILLPASAISGLSAPELRAILAHELAHIHRCDYLINLIQCMVEALLFYHPAVWWVSARIREEREKACDDIAAVACEDRLLLARALHALEEMRAPFPAFAVAARDGDLLARIRRLVSHREPEVASPAWAAVLMVALCAGLILTQAQVTSARAANQLGAIEPTGKPSVSPDTRNVDPAGSFKASLQAIQGDAEKQTEAAKGGYIAQLQGLLRNGLQAGDEQLALAAGAEISDVRAWGNGGADGEGNAPPEIMKWRDTFQKKLQSIAASADERTRPVLTGYTSWLQSQAALLDARGDSGGAARMRMEWMNLRLNSPSVSVERTRRLGGGGGGHSTDIPKPYVLLSGFKVRTGDFAGHNVITGLQALFHSPNGTTYGWRRGPGGPGDWVGAADGYAVGAIRANSGDRLDGFEVVFMKIDPSGVGLDPNDSYTSRWFGGHGGGGPTTIGGDGRPVVGVFGGSGLEIDSLGLIQATLNPPPVPKKTLQPTPAAP